MSAASIMPGASAGRFRRIGIEGIWIIAGNLVSVGGSLALVRVLTEMLNPAQYGEVALALTIVGLANQLIMGGIIAAVGRYWSVAIEQGDLRAYMGASISMFVLGGIAIAAVGLILLAGLAAFGLGVWTGTVIAALVLAVVSSANALCSAVQNAARQRPVVALNGALDAWLKIGLAFAIVTLMGASSTAVLWGYIASSALVTASQIGFLIRLLRRSDRHSPAARSSGQPDWLGQLWHYAWPFSTWGIFTWAQQASDRWALQGFASQADVGSYAVLFQLGYTPVALATGLMVTLLGPILYARSGDATDRGRNAGVAQATWRLCWCVIAATLAASGLIFLTSDWLFSILVSEAFREHAGLLGFMVLAGGVFAAGQVLALRTQSDMTVRQTIPVKIGSAVIGVILNVVLAYHLGLLGVVLGALAFSIIYFTWIALLIHRLESAIPNLSQQMSERLQHDAE